MSEVQTEASAIAELIQSPSIEAINGVPMVFCPSGDGAWEIRAMESLLPTPLRKKGNVFIHEVDSFIDFTKRHGSLSDAVVYLNVDYLAQKIEAVTVFNDHGEDVAGWQDHRAIFKPRMGAEWQVWNGNDKKRMSQADLAAFLEANIADIASVDGSKLPSGAEVLTFVSKLEETRTVKYGSAVNLQNGLVQLEFVEDNNTSTKGKLELFKEFALGIRVFFGGEAYSVKAFLRYRIDRNTGGIQFWYELQRADRVLEDACKQLIASITEKTGLPVVYGNAP